MRNQPPAWLTLASALYRLCARLASRAFRERFGRESEDDLRRLLEETAARRGQGAALATAAAACGDLVRVSVADRSAGWRRGLVCGLAADAARSIRVYWREPLLTTAIVFTLALVSGPALAIYGVLYHVLLAPLPYPDANRLFVVAHQTPRGRAIYLPAASVADYRNAGPSRRSARSRYVARDAQERTERVRVPCHAGSAAALGIRLWPAATCAAAGRGGRVSRLCASGSEAARRRSARPRTGSRRRRSSGDRLSAAVAGTTPGGSSLARTTTPTNRPRTEAVRQAGHRDRPPEADRTRYRPPADHRDCRRRSRAVRQGGGAPQLWGCARGDGSLAVAPHALWRGRRGVPARRDQPELVLARPARGRPNRRAASQRASGWRLIRRWLVDGLVFAWPGAALGARLGDLLMRCAARRCRPDWCRC